MHARFAEPKFVVGVVFVASLFMSILDTTIVNTALPAISRDFGVEVSASGTIAVGYLVSLAVFITASGWLGDRFGTKRLLLTALALFVVASAACGLARTLPELVAFRVVQGIGGGLLLPVGMTMLFRTFSTSERIHAARMLVVPTAVAPATGPLLGGVLVDHASWRWVFFVNLPVGVFGFLFGLIFLPEHREPAGAFDLSGFLLAAGGLGSLMFALSEGSILGWDSRPTLTCLAAGLVLLALLVRVELRAAAPMLRLRLLGVPLLRTAIAVEVLTGGAFLGTLYAAPLLYQAGLGYSAFQSGLNTFPEAVGVVVSSQIVSRCYGVVGARRLMVVGVVLLASSICVIGFTDAHTNAWTFRLLLFGVGFFMNQVRLPNQAVAFEHISKAEMGHASSLYNANRRLGAALGVAVVAAVVGALGSTTGPRPQHLVAYHAAFFVAAAVALAALPVLVHAWPHIGRLGLREATAAPSPAPTAEPAG